MTDHDSNRPWSSAEIESRVPRVVELLENAVVALRKLGETAARCHVDHKRAEAIAMLDAIAKGSKNADERKANVVLASSDELLAAELSEKAYQDQRTLITALRAELDVLRTLLVSRREAPG